MLYNVLPPLIFFASLGGIILVVSRVVLRVRREQVATELQSYVAQVSKKRLHKVQDLAGILAPNQISVQNFKNRISYLTHIFKKTIIKLVADVKDWQERKAGRIQQSKAQKRVTKPNGAARQAKTIGSKTEGIIPPTSRFRDPLKKIVIQAKEMSAKSHGAFKKYAIRAARSSKDRQVKTRIQSDEREPIERKLSMKLNEPTVISSEKSSVIGMLKKDEADKQHEQEVPESQIKTEGQKKTKSIGKFFKKERSKSVLEQAEEALADAQVQQVEDILVPYIVEHPRDTTAYMMLGKVAISRKNWAEATEIFEQVAYIKPETKGCYAALGEAAYEAGNLTKAIEALQRAHNQSPQDTLVIKRLIKIANRLDNQPMQRSLVAELKLLEQEDRKI